MKPGVKSSPEAGSLPPLLAFGAHPDDIEFGCGGVIAVESLAGRPAHLVVCSRGESGTHGTPQLRSQEAARAAEILRAELEFVDLDGDARLEIRAAHALRLASEIRRVRPGIVLAPTIEQNQHPDHWRLGTLVRDACRLARYGGVAELRHHAPHSIGQLLFYACSSESEPRDVTPILVDVSAPEALAMWQAAMEAHVSQVSAREYVELQLTRARLRGVTAGTGHAAALYPNDPIIVSSLAQLGRGARRF